GSRGQGDGSLYDGTRCQVRITASDGAPVRESDDVIAAGPADRARDLPGLEPLHRLFDLGLHLAFEQKAHVAAGAGGSGLRELARQNLETRAAPQLGDDELRRLQRAHLLRRAVDRRADITGPL